LATFFWSTRLRLGERNLPIIAEWKPAEMIIDPEVKDLQIELRSAKSNYPPMRSYHEGYAVIKEELDELWDEIKKKPEERSIDHLRKEALQVAAMAARFAGDLC